MRIFSVILALAVTFLVISCSKTNDTCNFGDSSKVAPKTEQDNLLDSITKYNIDANLAPQGYYYSITNPGTGAIVSNLCNTISVKYWGEFFDGRGFDSSSSPINLVLGQTILGWQKAIPLVKEGGDINIYIPPSLAYGSDVVTDRSGNVLIPANSYLVFKVHVESIR